MQGVDLNLDAFDLSQPEKFAEGAGCCSAPLGSLEASDGLVEPFLFFLLFFLLFFFLFLFSSYFFSLYLYIYIHLFFA